MSVVGVLMVHCIVVIGSMTEGCMWCNQTWGRQTEKGEKKSLLAITAEDERTSSLGVLRSWRRVLPQLCCSCLNSIQSVKRKTRLRWPLTPQTMAAVNNSSFLARTVALFALKIDKAHGFPGDICLPQATTTGQSQGRGSASAFVFVGKCVLSPQKQDPVLFIFQPWLASTARGRLPVWSAQGKKIKGLMIQRRTSVIIMQSVSSCASHLREVRVKKPSCPPMWCLVTHLCRQLIS